MGGQGSIMQVQFNRRATVEKKTGEKVNAGFDGKESCMAACCV